MYYISIDGFKENIAINVSICKTKIMLYLRRTLVLMNVIRQPGDDKRENSHGSHLMILVFQMHKSAFALFRIAQ